MLQLSLQDVYMHLWIDNIAAVAYVNRMGGLHSKNLCQLALQVWDWCLSRNLTILAEHLSGSQNQLADKESRTDSDSSELALDTQIFHRRMEMRGPCTGDLFASRFSAKLPTYFSWRMHGSRSESSVALTQSWNNTSGYAFLHFCLTSRYYLAKIRAEKVPWVLLIVNHTLIEITNLVSSTIRDVSGTSNCTPEQQLLANGSTRGSSYYIQ